MDPSKSHLKFTVHSKLGLGKLDVNILLVESIARFINAQLPLLLSVRLFILNVPLPLKQNYPNGNYDPLYIFAADPTEYIFNGSDFQ